VPNDVLILALLCWIAFIPISAVNAFVYRTASRLSYDDFQNMDKTLMEKIGRDEVGKSKWRKLSVEEKCRAAYAAVSSEAACDESLQATNFHAFLEALNEAVGGHAVQLALINQQVRVSLKSLSSAASIALELQKVHNVDQALGQPPKPYSQYFWSAYAQCRKAHVAAYKADFDPKRLHAAMSQLLEYAAFVKAIGGCPDEHAKIVDSMATLVRSQISIVLQNCKTMDDRIDGGCKLLYDWDEVAKCWRLDIPKCHECKEDTICRNECHVLLHPNADTIVESDWAPLQQVCTYSEDCAWMNQTTGEYVVGIKYDDTTKPPRDNPHHWVRNAGQWHNKFTKEIVDGDHNPASGKVTWSNLTPRDMYTMSQSILLSSYSKSFCESFGAEKASLEQIVHGYNDLIQRLNTKRNTFFRQHQHRNPEPSQVINARALLCTYLEEVICDDGTVVPKHPDKYDLIAQVKMPRRLSDPNHWGHLAWQFCNFVDSCRPKVARSAC
jgi:hypothetical protein